MKNMEISLDILFIDEYLRISHIEKNARPCLEEEDRFCARYKSDSPSTYVLEIPSGATDAVGIDIGNLIELPLLLR